MNERIPYRHKQWIEAALAVLRVAKLGYSLKWKADNRRDFIPTEGASEKIQVAG